MDTFLSTLGALLLGCVVVAPGAVVVFGVIDWGVARRWPAWIVVPLAMFVMFVWVSVLIAGAQHFGLES